MNKTLKYSLSILFIILVCSLSIYAQGPGNPPGGGGGGGPVGGGTAIPLDGGALAMIAAGAIMLYRKYMWQKKA